MTLHWETNRLSVTPDAFAPDGSEIRLLGRIAGGSVAHGSLPAGSISLAVVHRTVEEVWFVLGGRAELWRKFDALEEVTSLEPGMAITIPLGTYFQFRSLGEEPFEFVMFTAPPWPGSDEAVLVQGRW